MERGYLRLWRRTIESPVFSDPHLWHMASWCLLRAGHKKRAFRFQAGNQYVVVPLESGQFATGRNSGADELGIKPSTFYKRLKRLSQEPYNFITVTPHSSTLCTIVTICNWQHYQAVDINEEQPKVTSEEQARNKRVASGEQAGNTNKNVYNVQNVQNERKQNLTRWNLKPLAVALQKRYNIGCPDMVGFSAAVDQAVADGFDSESVQTVLDWLGKRESFDKFFPSFKRPDLLREKLCDIAAKRQERIAELDALGD